MALEGESVHLIPADLESLRDDLSGDAHVELVVGVPEAVVHHRVDERHVVDPNPPAGLLDQIGSPAHRLHAPREDDVRRTPSNHVRREHDGLQSGAAHLVDGHGADAIRQAGGQRGLAGRVLAQSRGDHVAHDDLLDVGGDQAGAVHRLRDDRTAELDRLDVPEGPPVLAHGSPASSRDHDIGQGGTSGRIRGSRKILKVSSTRPRVYVHDACMSPPYAGEATVRRLDPSR